MTLHQSIKNFLKQHDVNYSEIEHEPVFTSEQAAQKRGSNIEEGAKALLFLADGNPIQIVIQGNKRVDKDKFKKQFQFTKLKMASADQVKKISGVEPGAVPPFGNLFNPPIQVYATESLLQSDKIEFNAGDHCKSIRMNASDYKQIVQPIEGIYEEK